MSHGPAPSPGIPTGPRRVVDDSLRSWNDGAAKEAVLRFLDAASGEDSPHVVPPEERVAVFDNDGTLWCEQPLPIQLGFIPRRLAQMVGKDLGLRDRQPWKAARRRG